VPSLWSLPFSNSFSSQIREIDTAEEITRSEKKEDYDPSTKQQHHVEGDTLCEQVFTCNFDLF